QQPGGELDAADRTRKKKLVARRQREGGSEGSGHPVDRGILPQTLRACEGISLGRAPRLEWPHLEPRCQPHSCSLVGCSRLISRPGLVRRLQSGTVSFL